VLTHPGSGVCGGATGRRSKAVLRRASVTDRWVVVMQWFFGPVIVNRECRLSGGKCEVVETAIFDEDSQEKGGFRRRDWRTT
jgi:sulfate adenylyltransferase (ADP) / ATP adenylyltransferase